MKNKLMVVLLILGVAAAAFALVPSYINYQGILRNSAGDLQSGTFSMTFRIYDHVTDSSNLLLIDEQSNVEVSNGLYNAEVGPITGAIFDGGDRWLEVEVEGGILAPRLKINSVAYAWQSENAATADYATNAGAVDGISASTEANAGQLYPLDGNARLSGVSISAEANGSNNVALSVNGTMEVFGITGTGQINSGSIFATVINSYITTNSTVLLTAGHGGVVALPNSNGGIRVSLVTAGTGFRVATMDGNAASAHIPFSYLIIN